MVLDGFLIVVVAAHLMCVNVACAAPVLCLWLEWRQSRRDDEVAGRIGKYLARQSLVMLAAGVILGVGALGVVWLTYPRAYFGAARQIPAGRYLWGLAELAFSFALLGVYYGLWDRLHGHRIVHRALGALAATNLIYHFPPLFSAISVLSTRPETWQDAPLEHAALIALLYDPETMIRFAHFMVASFAETGILMIGYALRVARGGDAEGGSRIVVWGGRIALVATSAQLLVGTWLLLNLPQASQKALMGGDLLGTVLFAAGLLTVFALMHQLAAAALGNAGRRESILAMALLGLTMLMMVGTKQRAELAIHARIEADTAQDQ